MKFIKDYLLFILSIIVVCALFFVEIRHGDTTFYRLTIEILVGSAMILVFLTIGLTFSAIYLWFLVRVGTKIGNIRDHKHFTKKKR